MLDSKGEPLRVGTRVICDGMEGVVVCSIDSGEGSPEEPIEQWGYLKESVVIRTKEAGMIRYTDGSGIILVPN